MLLKFVIIIKYYNIISIHTLYLFLEFGPILS